MAEPATIDPDGADPEPAGLRKGRSHTIGKPTLAEAGRTRAHEVWVTATGWFGNLRSSES